MFTLEAAEALARGEPLPGLDFHPWVIAQLRNWTGLGRAGTAPQHTIQTVRAWGDMRLFRTLAEAGAPSTGEAFLEATEAFFSAWELSESWTLRGEPDEELIGLVSCELWRRLRPERPSLEMLDELMQQGFREREAGDRERACATWGRLWHELLALLPDDVETLDHAAGWLPSLESLTNWLNELEIELATLGHGDPAWAERGAELLGSIVARFQGCSRLDSVRRQITTLWSQCGQRERAVTELEAMIAESPDEPAAYAYLADLFSMGTASGEALDNERARQILREALERPVRDPESYDLTRRLARLVDG